MSEDSTTQCLLFPGIFRKPVVAQFDQREGSSDGGALLLKAADRHYGEKRVLGVLGARGCLESTLLKFTKCFEIMVSAAGFEPATHALKG